MITEHKQLLGQIAAAHKTATDLLRGGEKVDGIVKKLREAGDQVKARLDFYQAQAPAKKQEPSKAPETPDTAPAAATETAPKEKNK